ncbi:MAG: carbamate kinase [Bacilli bacterium]|nr:carbamate kinase [Bacilli bacterium]
MSKIVIALGGNALGNSPEEQLKLLEHVARIIVGLVKEGNQIVLTHGNGPQVGQIFLAMDYSANGEVKTPSMPFPECGSMSQGYIGYQLQQCLQDELERQHIQKDCATLITQVLVDPKDSAFNNPTKPIGRFYTKEEAQAIEKEKHYQFVEDSGRGYRRVVPSPKPMDIIEKRVIKQLVENDTIVISVGGGGIPVIKTDKIELLEGVEAVIDKDRSASLLAKLIEADTLLILTAVDKVCINFNKPNQKKLDKLTIKEAEKYMRDGHFAKGSMLPKIEACLDFVKNNPGKKAIIGSLDKAEEAIKGTSGTTIVG